MVLQKYPIIIRKQSTFLIYFVCLCLCKQELSLFLYVEAPTKCKFGSTFTFAFCVLLFFFFFFFFYTRFRLSGDKRTVEYCSVLFGPVFFTFLSISGSVHCSWTHKFHFLSIFSLKMCLTALFTHLKIILLQCFQF